MFKKIAEALLRNANNPVDGEMAFFRDDRYTPFPINAKNFHEIRNKDSLIKKIAFVDGGNAEIVSIPNLSLQIIRTYAGIFENNKKEGFKRREFYSLTYAAPKDISIIYKTEFFSEKGEALSDEEIEKIFGLSGADFTFDAFDRTIMSGNERASPQKIGEVIRRYAELSLAAETASEMKDSGIIVLDGTLQSSVTGEGIFLKRLYSCCEKKNVIVSALAKTSRLITQNGNSLIAAINSISGKAPWYYYPVAEISHPDHQAELFIAKLSEHSRHAFRFEVYKKSIFNAEEIFSLLAKNSNDFSFPGYPYGLIDADKFAQVTNEEKNALRARIALEPHLKNKLELFESSLNAHDILNRL